MALTEYRAKRNFRVTAEPKGAPRTKGRSRGKESASEESRLIFCVQKHAASHLHYDFRLELDGVLLSWAVPKGPSLNPKNRRLAMHVEDHPIDYADFEGTIPQGEYGGGTVILWDHGTWEPLEDPRRGYKKGKLKFVLHGEKLHGYWNLVRRSSSGDQRQWFLIKGNDEAVDDGEEIVDRAPLSVKTGRDLDEVAAGKPPRKSKRRATRKTKTTAKTSAEKRSTKRVKRIKATSSEPASAGPESPASRGRRSVGNTPRQRRSRHKSSDTDDGRATMSRSSSSATGALPITMPFEPQLATLADQVPEGSEWIHEQKLDGYRMLAVVDGGQVLLITRNGNDWTERFQPVADAVKKLRFKQVILDGEVIALDEKGVSSFQELQNAYGEQRTDQLKYYVFDLLFHNGRDLRALPLEKRKQKLEKLLAKVGRGGVVHYSEHRTDGERFYAEMCRQGEEGIISKRRDLPYRSGRSLDWLKIKCKQNQEMVIGGFTNPQGGRLKFGALLVGYYDGGNLRYAGKVGTGFNNRSLGELYEQLAPLEQRISPFDDLTSSMPEGRRVHWVAPRLVAQIEFSQWTEDGRLRHPVFQGLREDKAPKLVVREQPVANAAEAASATPRHQSNGHHPNGRHHENGSMSKKKSAGRAKSSSAKKSGHKKSAEKRAEGKESPTEVGGVRLTSPDKVLYPEQGITKLDLAQYYEQIGEWMIPYIKDRPLSLVRCPEGTGKTCFFQKHVSAGMPSELRQVKIKEEKKTGTYVIADDPGDLIALAQIGALEIHCWQSRYDKLERPDQMVFDLDPAPEVEWAAVVSAARRIRQVIEELGLGCLLKTTGGKGLHLVVPLVRRHGWEEVTAFCKALADGVSRADPENFTSNMSKKARGGKVFIDYLRNARGATAIAPFSTRARPGAPVATPISWDELSDKLRSDAFTIENLPQRLKKLRKDPWADFDNLRRAIPRSAWKTLGASPP